MFAYRNKPEIGKTKQLTTHPQSGDDPMACVWIPLIIGGSYFVLSAIVRVTNNAGSRLDQMICYGALICFVILLLLGARDQYRDSQAARAERQEWKKACKTAELAILNRRERGGFDDGYRWHSVPCRLELEMSADQRAVAPNQTIVSVSVNDLVYKRLEKRSTVRIYYRPAFPMNFLLEDEL